MVLEYHYLTQKEAQELDNELMSDTIGYKLEQLMEIAGLSCAICIHHCYPHLFCQYSDGYSNQFSSSQTISSQIMVICGPGNNGGDGLVIARYLKLFGGNPIVIYPKKGNHPLYDNLVTLLKSLSIPIIPTIEEINPIPALIIDSIFGFSFSGDYIKSPFNSIIDYMKKCSNISAIPIVSIDIPSGWNVDNIYSENDTLLYPDIIISLTAPKVCTLSFKGKHYIAGRFVPPFLATKYNIDYINKIYLNNNNELFTLL
ncbi:apolipoprotein A-I-binding protein precursor [Cryptosporidium andersoni]|uniref:NAD(P)H-hydrate epimerase n=1 Tax=Cryptosporidium andersoni TaxID=117008 RepID=A0A1J4MQ99_9CRYT|nr:apolipoprotein A-I-binding protein precursor [Cryptosporidium andersoni]